MKRKIAGLATSSQSDGQLPDGMYLVRIERIAYRWEKHKPFYSVLLLVVEPKPLQGASIAGRMYCTPKAMWKLSWFLHDFGYDQELLGRDEIDDRAVVGLRGVVKVTHTTLNGRTYQNLEAFAPAGEWSELATASLSFGNGDQEVA